MRNLPALSRIRKAARLILWGGGALGWIAAGLGRSDAKDAPAITVERGGAPLPPLWDEACVPVVASRKGKRYYYAWCEGAGQLKAQNLAEFCGPEAAERAGFTRAAGCGDPPEQKS